MSYEKDEIVYVIKYGKIYSATFLKNWGKDCICVTNLIPVFDTPTSGTCYESRFSLKDVFKGKKEALIALQKKQEDMLESSRRKFIEDELKLRKTKLLIDEVE